MNIYRRRISTLPSVQNLQRKDVCISNVYIANVPNCYSPCLFTHESDRTLSVYEIDSLNLIMSFGPFQSHIVKSCSASHYLFILTGSNNLFIFSLVTKKEEICHKIAIEGQAKCLLAYETGKTGITLCIGLHKSAADLVLIYDPVTQLIQQAGLLDWKTDTWCITKMWRSGYENYILCGGFNGHCGVFDITSLLLAVPANEVSFPKLDPLKSLEIHRSLIYSIVVVEEKFQNFPPLFFTCSNDTTIRLCNADTFQVLKVFRNHSANVTCLSICSHPDQLYEPFLVSGAADSSVSIYSILTTSLVSSFKAHGSVVTAVASVYWKDHEFPWLFSAGDDKQCFKWNLNSELQINKVTYRPAFAVKCLRTNDIIREHSRREKENFLSKEPEEIKRRRKPSTRRGRAGKELVQSQDTETSQGDSFDVLKLLRPDDVVILTGHEKRLGDSIVPIELWSYEQGCDKPIYTYETLHSSQSWTIGCDVGEDILITSSFGDRFVSGYSITTGKLVMRLVDENCKETAWNFSYWSAILHASSPSSHYQLKRVVAGNFAGRISVWDYPSGNLISSIEVGSKIIRAMDSESIYFADCDEWFELAVAGSRDSCLYLIDLIAGKLVGKFDGMEGMMETVQLKMIGKQPIVISGCSNGYLRVFFVNFASLTKSFEFSERRQSRFTSGVKSLIYYENEVKDSFVIAGYMNGSVIAWDFKDLQQKFVFEGHTQMVMELSLLSSGTDNDVLVSVSVDKTIRYWTLYVLSPNYLHPTPGMIRDAMRLDYDVSLISSATQKLRPIGFDPISLPFRADDVHSASHVH